MEGEADETLVVGGEEGMVARDARAQDVEVEARRVVVELLEAIFGLRDYARVVEGE